MLGLVPSICYVALLETWVDPRDKPEDDEEYKVLSQRIRFAAGSGTSSPFKRRSR